MKPVTLLVLVALLAGCSRLSVLREPPEATLADLQPVRIPQAGEPLPQVTLAELAATYREVLAVTEDPETRLLVLHRLADIEMIDSEAELALADSEGRFFGDAIAAYEALLRENPGNPLNDQLLYQLSKAYELSGYSAKSVAVLERLSDAYPESRHFPEAEFRKAESYFIAGDYAGAERAYARVIDLGQDTAYYSNALYMHGWTRFKQGNYRPAIASFSGTLDQLLPPDNDVESLPRGERELVLDCLRVLAVTFSYLEGADTIAAAYEQLGVRPYQHLLYRELGDLYLKQERFRDSAETYKAYTRGFPDSKVAHIFQIRVIESYQAGGFPDLIVAEKEAYVEAFGVSGSYWRQSDSVAQDAMGEQLKLFIDELAAYYHALAQEAAAADQAVVSQHYRTAADYYQLYIDSFPGDPDVPEMGFLLAESRFEAQDYREAIAAYEWVAYFFSDYAQAADAGYAAILSHKRLASSAATTEQDSLQRNRIESELAFASTFVADARAPLVLSHAAAALLERGEFQRAIIAAASLTRAPTVPGDEITRSAWLVQGHSHFELQQFADAEQAYQGALALMPGDAPQRAGTIERLAASIYKQAEQSVAAAEHLQAAQQFARVMAVAPRSEVRVAAQFDAASNYIKAGELAQANGLLLDFRQRYPDNALSQSIGTSLVANYEQLGQWQAAALELDALHATETDAERQRQALYLAAEYYDKAGNREYAILRYRSYAHEWPQPFAIRMEAMNRLAELYQVSEQEQKRRFWLQKMMATHDAAGQEQSERSRYLAAESASVLAESAYRAYRDIKLRYPIRTSLKKKKASMQRALAAWNLTHDYGVQEFATLATYRMGRIYQQLSRDLLASERPGKLDALALEQYELLLEEQAYPFEEKAIAIHESNARRSWEGLYDQWVMESFVALAELLPARYHKTEARIAFSHDIY